MKRSLLIPVLLLFLASLACSFGSGGDETPEPVEDPTVGDVTQEVEPVDQPEDDDDNTPGAGAIQDLSDAESAVVRIVVQGSYEYAGYGSYEESFSGSGFIIDPSGLAVTNNHVVTGAALVEVYFSDDPEPRRAKVVGYSECSDLAVIDIDGDGYPYFEWYTDPVERRMEVYALGYPLGDPEYTEHKGVISKDSASLATSWTDVDSIIEHDASTDHGSSGGPLVTTDAQVIGVNYSITEKQNYSISYTEAEPILADLMQGENVLSIGLNGEAFVTEDGFSGIWIYSVASGSPADQAGIRAGDILLEMEGISLAKDGTLSEYCGVLRGHDPEDVLGVKVFRYKTGEVMEGQINGRELESTGSLDVTDGGNTGGNGGATASGDYFVDEFDGSYLDYLLQLEVPEQPKDFAELTSSQRLKFEMPNSEVYSYVYNTGWVYDNVYVEAMAETISGNRNGMSVLCRVSDYGWYEFRISTRGLYSGSYEFYRYDPSLKSQGKNPYVNLLGLERVFTNDIKTGFNTNTIGMECNGSYFYLYINDVLQTRHNKDLTDNYLADGYVGVGAMSFADGPARIEFEYMGTDAALE